MNLFSQKKLVFRDYQEEPAAAALEYFEGKSKDPSLLIAPTGFGKSLIIGWLAEKIGKVLVIQPNKELLEQNFEKFRSYGGNGTIYSASAGKKDFSHCMFVTPGSIIKILPVLQKFGIDNIIIDEADFNCKITKPYNSLVKYDERQDGEPIDSQFEQIIRALRPKKILGLTATPTILKSNREGARLVMLNRTRPKFWKKIISVTQIQLMVNRYWAKLRYLSPTEEFDKSMLRLNSSGSEYTSESISNAIKANNTNRQIHALLRRMLGNGKRKSIIVYFDSIASAEACEKEFSGSCYAVSSKTKMSDRKRRVALFRSGKVPILANVRCFQMGFDAPRIDCLIMGAPTNSWRVWYQTVGRAVRQSPTKKDSLIFDMCGNKDKFGKIEGVTIEDYPGHKWGVFSGDRLITGHPMKDKFITKQAINAMYNPSYKDLEARLKDQVIYERMHAGRRLGSLVSEVPSEMLLFYLKDVHWKEMPEYPMFHKAATVELQLREKRQQLMNQGS